MITMKGKYNLANIMIDEIDPATREQIQAFLNHPAFEGSYIAIMPDCHKGIGAVIGLTMQTNDYIIPNVIGVDIGCGILGTKINKPDINLEGVDTFIRNEIPHGFDVHAKPIAEVSEKAEACASKIGVNFDRVKSSIGSLGGGNHFIEIGKSEDGLWIFIHSGSRNFGNQVARYHQEKAKKLLAMYHSSAQQSGLEFLLADSAEGREYLSDLQIAMGYAAQNRVWIMKFILKHLNASPLKTIDSVHNYIDTTEGIIRKGATAANEGQELLVPFNMRDGVAICEGKGNKKYNNSAPHGAGRILSRKKAQEDISMDEYKAAMSEVFTTSVSKGTLDEAPQAYKDHQMILDNIGETVSVTEMVKPIYNFKASN